MFIAQLSLRMRVAGNFTAQVSFRRTTTNKQTNYESADWRCWSPL